MKTSQKGIDLIKKYEGLRLNAYKPIPTEKYFTIGYGHYGSDVSPNMVITSSEAEALLKKDLKKFEDKVNKYDKYDWTQNEFDALVSFAYNIGNIDQLTQNGTRSKEQIAEKIVQYDKAGGKVLNGLVKRRKEEQEMFIGKVASTFTVKPATNTKKKVDKPILRQGMGGNDVLEMQTLLKDKFGYSKLATDGIFGPKTCNAVKDFQDKHSLRVDGICGSNTWSVLLG